MDNKCNKCGLRAVIQGQWAGLMTCKECGNSAHLSCIPVSTPPSSFASDLFFVYTCSQCSASKKPIFQRDMTWLCCLAIVLNELAINSNAMSNQGYFHWRMHISTYIDKNWSRLFGNTLKKKKNWLGSFVGVLSHYSHLFFKSGSQVLNESGWWKLTHLFPPSLIQYLYNEILPLKHKERANKTLYGHLTERGLEYAMMGKIVTKLGLKHLIVEDDAKKLEEELVSESSGESETDTAADNKVYQSATSSHCSGNEETDDYSSNYFLDVDDSMSDFDNLLPDFENFSENNSYTQQSQKINSDSQEHSTSNDNYDLPISMPSQINYKYLSGDEESNSGDNENEMQTHSEEAPKENNKKFVWEDNFATIYKNSELPNPTTEYDEIKILEHIENAYEKGIIKNDDTKMARLRAKLKLRKLKRKKHLPLFNLDSLVCRLANFPVPLYSNSYLKEVRVLDRFQSGNESDSVPLYCNFSMRLASYYNVGPFISPYSNRFLKPYILRDSEIKPLWLKVMSELKSKVYEKFGYRVEEEISSLDYCYIRPQHIVALNSLCSEFLWPGIDLTEVLQYPDFTCVALYKKLVVGFAVLVPDVNYNEAYISYIFTRPEWRRCGIANFMLYHLIQTCITKDITLHVSASNPAVFLYQKFGFKIEEVIQNFYDKYMAPESKECKHAAFLRLPR